MKLKRCYTKDRWLAYASGTDCSFAILFEVAAGVPLPPDEEEAQALVETHWLKAPRDATNLRKSAIIFFPTSTPEVAAKFAEKALAVTPPWDRFTYWSRQDLGSATLSFPTGSINVIRVRQWIVRLKGAARFPELLSDFEWKWEDERLQLSFEGAQWQVEDINGFLVSKSKTAWVDLSAKPKTWAGSLCFDVTPEVFAKLPIEFAFKTVTAEEDEFIVQRQITARAFHKVSGVSRPVQFCLDTRDSTKLAVNRLSRVTFDPKARITLNFVDERGLRVVCNATSGTAPGFARLQLEVEDGEITAEGKWEENTPSDAYFVVEGDFAVTGLDGLAEDAIEKDDTLRILAGASPTETVEARLGDQLKFESGLAAVMFRKGDAAPPNEDEQRALMGIAAAASKPLLMHDGNGLVTTSWMTVVSKSGAAPAKFVAEASEAPLFERKTESVAGSPTTNSTAASADASTPLVRAYEKLGELQSNGAPVYVPVFPWAGFQAGVYVTRSAGQKPEDFEQSHLGETRRLKVRPPGTPRPAPMSATAETSKLCVTPSGLIANVVNGDYRKLFFGVPDPGMRSKEFFITSPADLTAAYDDVQRALRSEDLFFVMYKPTTEGKAVFKPSTDETFVTVGENPNDGFSFEMRDDTPDAEQPVLLVKYFRNASLKNLVEGTTDRWACREHLVGIALDKMKEYIEKLVGPKPSESKIEAAWWNRVWTDPQWNGIVMLDVGIKKKPDLFKALDAGIKELSKFRFHHIGMDFLPVKQTDLVGAAPDRKGRAFALLKYDGKEEDDRTIDTDPDDKPPAGGPAVPPAEYRFKVDLIELLIVQSAVEHFKVDAQVGFDRLFWDEADASDKDKAVKLKGTYESRIGANGEKADIFKLVVSKQDIRAIEFKNSWFKTLTISDGELNLESEAGSPDIKFFIGFNSVINFDEERQPAFTEIIKVKRFQIDRAGLQFTYTPSSGKVSCRFKADAARAEIEPGDHESFLARFPLKLHGFRMAVSRMLDLSALNYVQIAGNPSFDFGLDLELDLGFLGGLSGAGKGFKVPVLLGWTRGGGLGNFSFGIQFPEWNGEDFQIGIQGFVAVKAKKAEFKRCRPDSDNPSLAIALSNAKLVLFGQEMPKDVELSLAMFIPTKSGRKVAWIFGVKPNDPDQSWLKYIAAGHRVKAPSGKDAIEMVKDAQTYLQLEEPGKICDLAGRNVYESENNGWLVLGEMSFLDDLAHAWFVLADKDKGAGTYALHLKLAGIIELGAAYRRLNDELGVFSAELGLADLLPPLQFGAASLRLPNIRTEVYTDGGWLVDLGFPWHNDFRRSFQIEIGIFLGSGGFYYGYTSAAASDLLMLEENTFGFDPPDLSNTEVKAELKSMRAVRAGIAARVGVGRSLNLGVLKGEASISIYGTLEGAAAFKNDILELQLYAIKGAVGLMVHIWAELDFVVLQARAEIVAYVEVGITFRRVLAQKGGEHFLVRLPTVLYAEVGIYVRFEVWATVGCVRVKLFDLSFKATWRIEEPMGDLKVDPLTKSEASVLSVTGARPRPPLRTERPWLGMMPNAAAGEAIDLFVIMLPCVAQWSDLGDNRPGYSTCMVSHYMLNVFNGFDRLSKFMVGWELDMRGDADRLSRQKVRETRQRVSKAAYWSGVGGDEAVREIKHRFTPVLHTDPAKWDDSRKVAVPAWPGLTWHFKNKQTPELQPMFLAGRGVAFTNDPMRGDTVKNVFVDFLRLITESLLDEIDEVYRLKYHDLDPNHPAPTWNEVWTEISRAL